jgi:hypothetical protein
MTASFSVTYFVRILNNQHDENGDLPVNENKYEDEGECFV